jgi:soluble lytic murein transglycosylase-like protein
MKNSRHRINSVFASLVMLALAAPSTAANEESPLAPSIFQLNVDEPDTFRLAKPITLAPLPVAPVVPLVVPSLLADRPFASQIHDAARDAALDPALVHAVIFVESRYNPAARSPKGAVGLMQVMPETAARYGVRNPAKSLRENLLAGTRYLSDLMLQFNSRLDLVLAAYNAGENAVIRYGRNIPPYRETQLYVPAVLAKYREWQEQKPSIAPALIQTPIQTPVQSAYEYLPGTRLTSDYLHKVSE